MLGDLHLQRELKIAAKGRSKQKKNSVLAEVISPGTCKLPASCGLSLLAVLLPCYFVAFSSDTACSGQYLSILPKDTTRLLDDGLSSEGQAFDSLYKFSFI